MNTYDLGAKIKSLRLEAGETQEEMALGLMLSNRCTVHKYENNERVPTDEIKIRICNRYNCSMDFLMGLTNIKQPVKHIENQLKELELSDLEYFSLVQTWCKERKLSLPMAKTPISKIEKANLAILNIYMDYLKNRPVDECASIEEAQANTESLDIDFFNMLNNLEKK